MDDRFYILVSGNCAVERHGQLSEQQSGLLAGVIAHCSFYDQARSLSTAMGRS